MRMQPAGPSSAAQRRLAGAAHVSEDQPSARGRLFSHANEGHSSAAASLASELLLRAFQALGVASSGL